MSPQLGTKGRILAAAIELDRATEAFGRAVAEFREAIRLGVREASSAGLGQKFIGVFGWSHVNRNIEALLKHAGLHAQLDLGRIVQEPKPPAESNFPQKVQAWLEKW